MAHAHQADDLSTFSKFQLLYHILMKLLLLSISIKEYFHGCLYEYIKTGKAGKSTIFDVSHFEMTQHQGFCFIMVAGLEKKTRHGL